MRDVTAQKELERMKDAFVSNVSHELRTPIAGIKLFLGLLERAVTPEIRDDLIPTLKRETNRLNEIIEDVLRLSRLDQGRVEFDPKPVDLNTLAEEYATDRAPLAENRGLTLTLNKAAALPPIQADPGLLGQALSALLTNALNYTPRGGKIVICTKVGERDGTAFAGVGISDTGPGIPPDERDRLFERFFRGAAAVASGAPGTGLGLSIAKEIVDRHGGWIEAESEGEPGKGTTFTVWLPVEESANGH
jgi:two-component system phosphate regulon sensor histidine kinase PhoR